MGTLPQGQTDYLRSMTTDKILILDFGSQYTQLIARRVREIGVYCELHPWDMSDEDIRVAMIAQQEGFRDNAPTTAAEAADIILNALENHGKRTHPALTAHV